MDMPPKAPPRVSPGGWITLNAPGGPAGLDRMPVSIRADTVVMLRPNPFEGVTGVYLINGASVEVVETAMEIEIAIANALRSGINANASHSQIRRVA